MVIGIPKETMPGESRVSATPETVSEMVKSGATVLVEKSAGKGAFLSDESYIAAGAVIVEDCEEIFEKSDVILKVKEPQYNAEKGCSEIDLMHSGQYLIAFLHPASPANHPMVKEMARKGIIGLTLDGIPRISRAQNMDALTSMSTCAGYKGILMAASMLPKFVPQIVCAAGFIRPSNVMVIGAGVAGLQAIATARRLGAVVYAADIRPEAAEQAKSLGARIVDTGVPSEIAVGEGGYAKPLPEEWMVKERDALKETISKMDIVFCSALVPSRLAPVLVTEEIVESMQPGSVIVDISIDQGGNCAITVPGEITNKHGVTILGIKNIPGILPVSSTWMFAKNVCNLFKYLTKDNQIVLDLNDEIVAGILTTYNGEIVHVGAREAMGI
ncbi:MAG: NAD(P) transhydrogenase subunit alpha [Clostridiaceae bacterium]|nr:NAD(P) transhydrogenase subunit alpha [Clostridiaceae bacterium]